MPKGRGLAFFGQLRTFVLTLYERGLLSDRTVLEAFDFDPLQDLPKTELVEMCKTKESQIGNIQEEEDILYTYLDWYAEIKSDSQKCQFRKNMVNAISMLEL